jgi:serine/threonine protein kinase
MAQICDSLAEAHALGLIHRDVKPGNVFLCRRGGVPDCVKVLDFGLVRDFRVGGAVGVDGNGAAEVEGTPWFMPPEAIQGSVATDPRSDIYSLAALGYFLLTGYFIFDAETVAEIHEKQLTAVPVPPAQRTTNAISPEMEKLLLQCLEKDMDARPNSVMELQALLLATPAAGDWTPEAREDWWKYYERQSASSPGGETVGQMASAPTIRIDLAGRME